jgi:proline racemase
MVASGIAQWAPGEVGAERVRQQIAAGQWFVHRIDGVVRASLRVIEADEEVWGARPPDALYVHGLAIDRSATGTGLSARMAALHARGMMQVGDGMTHASVIGSTFDGRIVSETTVGGRPAIVPAIRGSAWITGVTQVVVDPTDPFPEGYVLADTWPGKDVQL